MEYFIFLLQDNKVMSHSFNRIATHVKHSPDSPIISSMRALYNKLIQVAQTISTDCSAKMVQWPLDVLMDSYFDVTHPMKCGLMTLIHADLWINNILFKQDSDGHAIDVKIVDYQMSFWGSPNADLIYLLFTSVMDDVKVKYFDEIIEFYYGELRSSLELVKYGEYIPTVEELREDLMENRMYGKDVEFLMGNSTGRFFYKFFSKLIFNTITLKYIHSPFNGTCSKPFHTIFNKIISLKRLN